MRDLWEIFEIYIVLYCIVQGNVFEVKKNDNSREWWYPVKCNWMNLKSTVSFGGNNISTYQDILISLYTILDIFRSWGYPTSSHRRCIRLLSGVRWNHHHMSRLGCHQSRAYHEGMTTYDELDDWPWVHFVKQILIWIINCDSNEL